MSQTQINGIVALCGKDDVIPKVISALKSLSHRAWSGFAIITEDDSSDDISTFDKIKSNLAIGCCLAESNNNKSNVKIAIHGNVYFPEDFNFHKRLEEISEKGLTYASEILSKIDGDFTFVMIKEGQLIFGRDPLGVKPLYFARDTDTISVASEIKPLKNLGFKNIERVCPGSIHKSSKQSLDSFLFSKILPSSLRVDMDEASDIILHLLSESIRRRLKSLDRAVIGFSGGLDSSLLALITSKFRKVTLLSIYSKGSKDEKVVKNSARSLGLELEEFKIDTKEVKNKISLVKYLIEQDRIMDLALGLGIHLTAEKCSQLGHKTLFLGQFADELFGGYAKYVKVLRQMGEEFVEKIIYEEVLDAHKNNFERDEKTSSPYVEVRLPYTNIDLVKYALSLPLKLKISRVNGQRKLVLQEVARKADLPKDIVIKRKKAFQYSSGIQKLVKIVKDYHLKG